MFEKIVENIKRSGLQHNLAIFPANVRLYKIYELIKIIEFIRVKGIKYLNRWINRKESQIRDEHECNFW